MTRQRFDSIVVGGGSGGLAFARTAAGLGARVLLVEKEDLGGTCVNRGCVPKKILWSAGKLNRSMVAAQSVGVFNAPQLDFAALAHRRDSHIASLQDSFAKDLADVGVTLVRGQARMDGTTVTVDGLCYTAENVIVATGARPTKMDIEGSVHLVDSRDVLSWTALPASMAIIGGGYIGCEFAAIFRAFGVDVTLVHDGDTVLDTFPASLADHAQTGLRESGISLRLNAGVSAVAQTADGLTYTLSDDRTGLADVIVAAVGRTPNVDNLGPLSDGLTLADNGSIKVDDHLATNVPGVYALGDAANRMPLTPVATADGTQLAHMLHGNGGTLLDLDDVTTTTFVYPPAAFVGDTGTDTGTDPRTDSFRPLSDNILTQADGSEPQLYRIGFDASGTLTGAEIIAEHAEDLIALIASLRRGKAQADTLDRIIPIHPSFAEEFLGT